MDLKVAITITDELSEDEVHSKGMLNLASGEIQGIEYEDYDAKAEGLPAFAEDYQFTCGMLTNNSKDVEFKVDVNKTTGQYSVSADELLELKLKAAALFAGVSGASLAAASAQQAMENELATTSPRGKGRPGGRRLH